ncbi:helix-turn-helix transcriptional regulator [Flavobacterium sp. F-380]|uniref:Helix-turn-helix transcriptional regulator n=1 Tax=Flavobacterium kayseriense TaxID=2764714 RepID=A0ABR7JAM8_9FLAO|nr:AraC family transcriptional regulator [Flavobacterium kayseriense]MBC5842438.1 helix-turn-helix transcriptional regulator [Flavobacterium kayseriense]MBC5848968.1 helix-turn-helix transcriptional regulator [Flavobacterium kayseriense]
MKTIVLPDELPIEKLQFVQVYDYHTKQEITKQQIILNQNTFSFLTEGTKEVFFDSSALSIDNSSFLLMKAGHCLMTEKLSAIHNYRSILLFFSNEIILKIMRKASMKMIKAQVSQSVYAFQYDAFIQRFVASLLDISKLSQSAQAKLLEVKLEEILLYLTEMNGFDFLNSLLSNGNNNKQKLIYTVESNVFSKLTIPELAFLCNMSISTFKREFEKCYSDSPMKWFQNKRLEHAHYLIHQEQKNASEIYLDIGYENLSSFIQAYKIKYGITPGQDSKN